MEGLALRLLFRQVSLNKRWRKAMRCDCYLHPSLRPPKPSSQTLHPLGPRLHYRLLTLCPAAY